METLLATINIILQQDESKRDRSKIRYQNVIFVQILNFSKKQVIFLLSPNSNTVLAFRKYL